MPPPCHADTSEGNVGFRTMYSPRNLHGLSDLWKLRYVAKTRPIACLEQQRRSSRITTRIEDLVLRNSQPINSRTIYVGLFQGKGLP